MEEGASSLLPELEAEPLSDPPVVNFNEQPGVEEDSEDPLPCNQLINDPDYDPDKESDIETDFDDDDVDSDFDEAEIFAGDHHKGKISLRF